MKEANGQGAMSKSEEDLYIHLADIHSRMEATNTFIEMVIEARAGKERDTDLEGLHAQMADHKKEWEDCAKEPVKVAGTVS